MPHGDRLLLLAPSTGLGGGIERVAAAFAAGWPGPVTRLELSSPGRTGGPAAKSRLAVRALHAARTQRPGLVLALHVGLLPVAAAAAALARTRLGAFGHGVEVWQPMARGRRALVRRSDVLLASSTFSAQRMAQEAGLPAGRVVPMALPLDPALLRCAGVRAGARSPARLLTVSRIERIDRFKGHFAIAEALPAIVSRRPDVRWIVVGDGDDTGALRARCAELRIAGHVDFTGPVSEARLAELYAEASVFVLPSVTSLDGARPDGEGFGIVYAEAAAFGVPSIGSTSAGGAADLLSDEVTALTVPPGDSAALATAVLRLIEDPELRERLGAGARRAVLDRHTPERFAETLAAIAGGSAAGGRCTDRR